VCERDCEHGWWHGGNRYPRPGPMAVPTFPGQVTVYPDQDRRVLGPDGHPIPRRVHRIGFQAEMVTEET
jgi:hypothetical protein